MVKNILLENEDNRFVTTYGTTCGELKPRVLYLRTKAKITPSVKRESYAEDIEKIKKEFILYIDKQVQKSPLFEKDYLSSIDITSKNMVYGKVSFLKYEVFLKPVERKTIEKNQNLFLKYSNRFNKKLSKMLNKSGIVNR